jgi:hypothetical protein
MSKQGDIILSSETRNQQAANHSTRAREANESKPL